MDTRESQIDKMLKLSSWIHRAVGDGALVLEVAGRGRSTRLGELEVNDDAADYVIEIKNGSSGS